MAPVYLLNNPNDCVRSKLWMVSGDLPSRKGTLQIAIPLTSEKFTASYVMVSVGGQDGTFSGIKPLIVYGLDDKNAIKNALKKDPTIQKVNNGEPGTLVYYKIY